jgi:hypothetical protein
VLFVNIHCVQCRIYSGCLPKALGQNKNRSFEEKICNQSDFFLTCISRRRFRSFGQKVKVVSRSDGFFVF